MLEHPDKFEHRHIGPSADDIAQMSEALGYTGVDELIDQTVPNDIRLQAPLTLPTAAHESEVTKRLRTLADGNQVFRSYIGMGYYGCLVPPVIQRRILENPGWYTQYTPYQAEIAQGRLETLLNFQTMVCDLTGMDIANASLLDEATAAAEAMTMAYDLKSSADRQTIAVADHCHPQTIEVLRTRAEPLGLNVRVGKVSELEFDSGLFAVLVQYPATDGEVMDLAPTIDAVHQAGALAIVATDLLALTLLKPPGEFGADIAVGSAQRFGVPMGFGGPHAAFFATRDSFKRRIPGRIVGVSKDSRGKPAYRLALQTREQHIRREKATSNICTAQALLANMAAIYAIYHGPNGLRRIADRVHLLTKILAAGLTQLGYQIKHSVFFDTLYFELDQKNYGDIHRKAVDQKINLRHLGQSGIGVSLDETTNESAVNQLLAIFGATSESTIEVSKLADRAKEDRVGEFARTSPFLQQPVFNQYHSETELLRYLRRLESRDLSLTSSMIPLGSCTMKLNATVEMQGLSWPEINSLHPFAPQQQTHGYLAIFSELEAWLAEITGFDAISLQPNAGSQGEYAGLLAIRKFHRSHGQENRTICLIPRSAHGTNPASAVMAGLKVVAVECDQEGNIDVADLRVKAEESGTNLAALMITYPSTHGVFEDSIREICQIVHDHGGQVYMDGANLNAQVGLCRPGDIGADVCHLNLHKTFCIPHGGGGPGVGPIGVAEHLTPYLPSHSMAALSTKHGIGPVAAAPWGSASIVTISWVYIAAMGAEGLTAASKVAILNANYIAHKLSPYYPVLYKGNNGLVAHECIIDLRQLKSVTVEDVAKRLMDYGYHAPTISWPVAGTMMIEPTESESMTELDHFCEALISIHEEIMEIESGQADARNNLLKNAPHTADVIVSDTWDRPYSRERAAFPVSRLKDDKFWPHVGRIDNVFGDRNPVCTCTGMEEFE